jgi:hypothetical protein
MWPIYLPGECFRTYCEDISFVDDVVLGTVLAVLELTMTKL